MLACRLASFVEETLLLPAAQVSEALTPTITQRVELHHLAALYKGMDERAHGVSTHRRTLSYSRRRLCGPRCRLSRLWPADAAQDPIQRIALQYREPLPEALEAALEASLGQEGFDCAVVLEALRDLITEQLTVRSLTLHSIQACFHGLGCAHASARSILSSADMIVV